MGGGGSGKRLDGPRSGGCRGNCRYWILLPRNRRLNTARAVGFPPRQRRLRSLDPVTPIGGGEVGGRPLQQARYPTAAVDHQVILELNQRLALAPQVFVHPLDHFPLLLERVLVDSRVQ